MLQIVKESTKKIIITFTDRAETSDLQGNVQLNLKGNANNKLQMKEIMARASKKLLENKQYSAQVNIAGFIEQYSIDIIREIVEGLLLGTYETPRFPMVTRPKWEFDLTGVADSDIEKGNLLVKEMVPIVDGIMFARDMVNMPGNHLRPVHFTEYIKKFMNNLPVECEILSIEEIRKLGMNGLLEIGDSSAYKPYFMILRYLPLGGNTKSLGLIGKGVTCDTGGYCLKKADSMLGIKGDMAGGAAVAGTIYALAKNKIEKNVIGCIPICENRISSGSLLPGDVITAYDGTTIEIANTDAEGRLILADAISYAIKMEKIDRVLDIATLTGAVVSMLGFSIAGLLCDDEILYSKFEKAYKKSGEQYLRLPFLPEHEKMIESKIADIKNTGEKYCGTITAGLFIRKFSQGIPWIHLDIAGTAWVNTPVYQYQTKGATGFGVTTLYYLCC